MVDPRQAGAFATDAMAQADDEPSSEVRRVETIERPRVLRVFTRHHSAKADGAWLTVTDDRGYVQFEGPLSENGSVELSLAGHVERVCILLETARSHRQTAVLLGDGLTEYVFV
jgi:hypothetical protein